jgi:hypothetical protein
MVSYLEILETTELKDFDKLYLENFSGDFPLPTARNITPIRTVMRKGRPLASGLIKAFAEAIIVTDQRAPMIARTKGIDMLVDNMMTWCKAHNVEQVHAFVKEDFAKFLIERYGFERTREVSIVVNTGA